MNSMEQRVIKPKPGLSELAKQLGSVSQACKVTGYSRDGFYRFKELYETGGAEALMDIIRKKPIRKNRVPEHVEQAVVDPAIANPALGQLRASYGLQKRGVIISSTGVRSVWLRHDLETMKKRLKALEAESAQDGILLTEEQVAALEKAKEKREAYGEIDTQHPGYLGSQDTYYVGTMKGVGRIYQQTFVDAYGRVADAELYTEKTAITAADMLNDRVVPFFEAQDVPLLRVLTDRGTAFCGKIENHAYQLYRAVENIDHSRTKAYTPRTNGICERFHKTLKNEFYDTAFRKKLYTSPDELQADLDPWLNFYDNDRPHSGKFCYGKTPMQTFLDAKHIAQEKNLSSLVAQQNSSDSQSPAA